MKCSNQGFTILSIWMSLVYFQELENQILTESRIAVGTGKSKMKCDYCVKTLLVEGGAILLLKNYISQSLSKWWNFLDNVYEL